MNLDYDSATIITMFSGSELFFCGNALFSCDTRRAVKSRTLSGPAVKNDI